MSAYRSALEAAIEAMRAMRDALDKVSQDVDGTKTANECGRRADLGSVSIANAEDALRQPVAEPVAEPVATQRTARNLFAPGDVVRHRNCSEYRIVGRCTIEATMDDCYAYRDTEGHMWVRPVGEMEDGRFTSPALPNPTPPPCGE